MSQNILFNGVVYEIPDVGEDGDWGQNLTDYFVAIPSGALQKSGGAFTLTADANFGGSFGLVSTYFKSRSSNIATAGALRLANTDAISWRNAANGANLPLAVDSSNNLTYNGVPISSSSGVVPPTSGGTGISSYATGDTLYASASNVLSKLTIGSQDYVYNVSASGIPQWTQLSNASIANSAAIAYSKLALTGSIVNGDVSNSAAIAYSKLNLSSSIVNADVSASAAIAYSKLSLTGGIVNADVNAAAAIAYSKLNLSGSVTNSDLAGSIAASKLVGTDIATVGTVTSGTWSATTIAVNKGGTGVTSVTTAPAASSWAGWDGQKNLSADAFIEGYATTATAAGTTTLTVDSVGQQYFTGSTTQTVTLPVTSTMVTGQSFNITNLSSGVVTVQSSGGNTLQAMAANTQLRCTVISTSGTGTASWNWAYSAIQNSLAGGGTITALTGDVTASGSGSVAATLAATSNGTLATLSKSTGVAIHGTNTNDSAAAGYNGEYFEALQSTNAACPATATWANLGSGNLPLTAGDWEISYICFFDRNSSTWNTVRGGIGTVTGNDATGITTGVSAARTAISTATDSLTLVVPPFRVSLSGSQTYYGKIYWEGTGGPPNYAGRISARRMR